MPVALRQKGRVDAALLHYNAIYRISAARLPAEKFDGAVSLKLHFIRMPKNICSPGFAPG
jgi:hypothetical protein